LVAGFKSNICISFVNYIKVKRHAWAGHVARVKNDEILKKEFNSKPEEVRGAGR
jgi:hypothetical protein